MPPTTYLRQVYLDTVVFTYHQLAYMIDVFGPDRVVFGGDWPVAKLACSYIRWLDLARQFTAHLPPAEQAAIFHGNAMRVYRV